MARLSLSATGRWEGPPSPKVRRFNPTPPLRDRCLSGRDDRELFVDPVKLSLACTESTDDLRIELRTIVRKDLVGRLLPRERRSIRTVACHRVERVGQGEDPRAERDAVAPQS